MVVVEENCTKEGGKGRSSGEGEGRRVVHRGGYPGNYLISGFFRDFIIMFWTSVEVLIKCLFSVRLLQKSCYQLRMGG